MARGQRNGSGFQEDPPRPTGRSGDGPEDAAEAQPPAGNGHNSDRAKRLEAEDAAIAKWCALQDQEDKLIEKHLDPIRKKKAKLKADLKAEYEIPVEAFNARAALRRIELRGEDEVVLAMRELLEATPMGKNIDFVVLAERVKAKEAEKAAAKAKAKSQEAEL